MGTTLTGTTPQDTYDSLIKVTNNGPLSSTARYLSDGLGNDSVLALSTSRVGIGTTSPDTALDVNGGSKFRGSISGFGGAEILLNAGNNSQVALSTNGTGTTEMYFDHRGSATGIWRFRDTADTRMSLTSVGLGIGTSSPTAKLDVSAGPNLNLGISQLSLNNFFNDGIGITFSRTTSDDDLSAIGAVDNDKFGIFAREGIIIATGGGSTYSATSETARFTTNGLTFNGDTAAANALDDYEEGTWTMGISFGGGSTGITYNANTGTYTKIGRQVTVNGYISLTSKGSSTGNALLTGLPFTIGNSIPNFSVPSLWFNNVSFTNQFQGYANYGTTTVLLQEITTLGSNSSLTNADFANNSEIMVSLTYFV